MAMRFANWLVRLRWWIVAGWVAGAIGLAVFTPTPDPGANEVLTFLPDDAASVRAAELMKKYFPASAGLSQAVVVIERPGQAAAPAGQLTAEDMAALNRLAGKLRLPLERGRLGQLRVLSNLIADEYQRQHDAERGQTFADLSALLIQRHSSLRSALAITTVVLRSS